MEGAADARIDLYGYPDKGCRFWTACLACPFETCKEEEFGEQGSRTKLSVEEMQRRQNAVVEKLLDEPKISIDMLHAWLTEQGFDLSRSTTARLLREAKVLTISTTKEQMRQADRSNLIAILKNWTETSRPSYTRLAQMLNISTVRARDAVPELDGIQWADVLWRAHTINKERDTKRPGSYV